MHSRFLSLAAMSVLITAISVRAQQPPAAQASTSLVPATAASIVALPDRFIGQKVSVYATADAALSPTTFLVDHNAAARASSPLLVVAPSLTTAPKGGSYVTVVGEVLRFSPDALRAAAGSYSLDLSAEQIAAFTGKPMVLAQQVYDADMTDLAKPKPVPLTPEEIAFDAVMKKVNPAVGEVRKGLEAGDVATTRREAENLAGLFKTTEQFFLARKTEDAVRWAREAATLAESIASQATSGNVDGARSTVTRLQTLCQSCHTAHRERDEDGQYRIRRAG